MSPFSLPSQSRWPHVEVIAIVQKAHLSLLRGRFPGAGLGLDEILGRLGQIPDGLIQFPIDRDGFLVDINSGDFLIPVGVDEIDLGVKVRRAEGRQDKQRNWSTHPPLNHLDLYVPA